MKQHKHFCKLFKTQQCEYIYIWTTFLFAELRSGENVG